MRKTALPLLLSLGLLLSACGSGSDAEVATLDETVTTPSASADELDADAEENLLEFAQCMRDNGVPEFPDPSFDGNGNLEFGARQELGVDRETLNGAFEACGDLVEGLIQNFIGGDFTELEDTFLEFAECMRDNGIDMPDPDFSQGFGPGAGGRAGIFGEDVDPESPEFQAAAEECQSIFEGQFGFGGPGGGRSGDNGNG
jgi:hypothetical protein